MRKAFLEQKTDKLLPFVGPFAVNGDYLEEMGWELTGGRPAGLERLFEVEEVDFEDDEQNPNFNVDDIMNHCRIRGYYTPTNINSK